MGEDLPPGMPAKTWMTLALPHEIVIKCEIDGKEKEFTIFEKSPGYCRANKDVNASEIIGKLWTKKIADEKEKDEEAEKKKKEDEAEKKKKEKEEEEKKERENKTQNTHSFDNHKGFVFGGSKCESDPQKNGCHNPAVVKSDGMVYQLRDCIKKATESGGFSGNA